jgi:hypothetical protein
VDHFDGSTYGHDVCSWRTILHNDAADVNSHRIRYHLVWTEQQLGPSLLLGKPSGSIVVYPAVVDWVWGVVARP